MTLIRVLIATTEGPVAVQKITAEEPGVPSVACRDGTTEVLAISSDYTRFVDRGTGLVARLTGHGAYRLDLDRPVDGGSSWQLPVLLAHLLEGERRLAGPDDSADLVVVATGEIDREQRIRPVGRIAEKLAAAGDLIARCGANGPPLVVLLPSDDWRPDIGERLRAEAGGAAVRVLQWDRVRRLTDLETPEGGSGPEQGVAPGSETAPEGGTPHEERTAGGHHRPPRVGRAAWVVLLLLAASVLGAGAAWWNGPRYWDELRRAGEYVALDRDLRQAVIPGLAERYRAGLLATAPPPDALAFSVVEQRTADGAPCSRQGFRRAEHVERADLVQTPVSAHNPGFFRSDRGASLCEAVYRVTNEGGRLFYLYFAVRPVFSARADDAAGAEPLRRAAALPPGASLTLDLALAGQPVLPLGADLLVLAVPRPAPQLRLAFESATAGDETPAARRAEIPELTALPALGMTVKGASHAILR